MELTFNKATHGYVAEFEATADFNLHIERKTGGDILLYQRTQGGGWDIVDDFRVLKHQGVIDYDCTALVYPKYIKLYSVSEPTYAAVVSDGEVTEIKSQSKEIEVTANGTTVVEPDAGFAYLNKVSVKTNVEGAGGGGGTELEGEYFLAKPNGRYWKTKFFDFDRPNVPDFNESEVPEEQVEMVMLYIMVMATCGYSVIGYRGGMPDSAHDTTSFSPIESCTRCSSLITEFSLNGHLGHIPAAFEEYNSSLYHNGIIDLIRILGEGAFDGMTDDEVLALASEMLMIEPVTKEEYDTWKYWNIN